MTREQELNKLFELIRETSICMMATIDGDGQLRSRPMANQSEYRDNSLYFFTDKNSPKVKEIRANPHVNLSYGEPKKNHYVSVSGQAELVLDKELMKEFWKPIYKAWFPEGLDDPSISLLKVTIEKAEFWDTPSSVAVQIVGFTKAMLTGQRYEPKDGHRKIEGNIQDPASMH